jgi:hypothetical protein
MHTLSAVGQEGKRTSPAILHGYVYSAIVVDQPADNPVCVVPAACLINNFIFGQDLQTDPPIKSKVNYAALCKCFCSRNNGT